MTDELARIQLALCLKEKECPACRPGGIADKSYGHFDLDHSSPGKVPLLEGVREKCPKCKGLKDYPLIPGTYAACPTCNRRGWVPSTDPWKWFEAVMRGGYDITFIPFGVPVRGFKCLLKDSSGMIFQIEDTTELAFFRALAQALGVK